MNSVQLVLDTLCLAPLTPLSPPLVLTHKTPRRNNVLKRHIDPPAMCSFSFFPSYVFARRRCKYLVWRWARRSVDGYVLVRSRGRGARAPGAGAVLARTAVPWGGGALQIGPLPAHFRATCYGKENRNCNLTWVSFCGGGMNQLLHDAGKNVDVIPPL